MKKNCATSFPTIPGTLPPKLRDSLALFLGVFFGEIVSYPVEKWGAKNFNLQKFLSPREGLREPHKSLTYSIGYRLFTRSCSLGLPLVLPMINPEDVASLREWLNVPIPNTAKTNKLVATFTNTALCTFIGLGLFGNYIDNRRVYKQMGISTPTLREQLPDFIKAPLKTYLQTNGLTFIPSLMRNTMLFSAMTVCIAYTENPNPSDTKSIGFVKALKDSLLLGGCTSVGFAVSAFPNAWKLHLLVEALHKEKQPTSIRSSIINATQKTKYNFAHRVCAGGLGGFTIGLVINIDRLLRTLDSRTSDP